MLRFVWGQLVNRPSRPAVLALTVLVAAASFVLLTATGRTTEARVQGSVESNYRTAYDILVRPKDSATPLERSDGLVRNNYLSGLFGGITMKQWRQIKAIPGVDVAAPVANIGVTYQNGSRVLRLEPLLDDDPIQIYRVRTESWAPGNTSRFSHYTEYLYYNRTSSAFRQAPDFGVREQPADGTEAFDACSSLYDQAPKPTRPYETGGVGLSCFYERSPGKGSDSAIDTKYTRNTIKPGQFGVQVGTSFPILIAGIDPDQESRLLGLDRAVVAGRFLRPGEPWFFKKFPPSFYMPGQTSYGRFIPTIASTRPYGTQYETVSIERLEVPRDVDVPRTLGSTNAYTFLTSLSGEVVERDRVTTSDVYEQFLLGDLVAGRAYATHYWRTSPVEYSRSPDQRLHPVEVRNPLSVWYSQPTPGSTGAEVSVRPANADIQFRKLEGFPGSPFFPRGQNPADPSATVSNWAYLELVGRYDPEKLRGFSPLSRVPLETYYPPSCSQPMPRAERRSAAGLSVRPRTWRTTSPSRRCS